MAAGKGTRMKSDLPKVVHLAHGKPMVVRIIDALNALDVEENILILGHKKEKVLEVLGNDVSYVVQEEQLGTGHAVKQAIPKIKDYDGDVLIINGDIPLIRKQTLIDFYNLYKSENADGTKTVGNAATGIELLRSVVSIRSYAITRTYESEYKMGAVSATYRAETRITLAAYHEAGMAYEKGATEIRADLGDSIRKAFGNIDEVLSENNLELTEANRKAVKLLAYNKAEVSVESVTKMKVAATLTETALKELKPATVAGLIKSGINPLDLDMEELLKRAKENNLEEVKLKIVK